MFKIKRLKKSHRVKTVIGSKAVVSVRIKHRLKPDPHTQQYSNNDPLFKKVHFLFPA